MQSVFNEYMGSKGYGNKSLERAAFIVTKPMRTISFISPLADGRRIGIKGDSARGKEWGAEKSEDGEGMAGKSDQGSREQSKKNE